MDDIIQMGGQAYVLATSPLADHTSRVLKHGDSFAVFDNYGDIQLIGSGAQGIYDEATRFLSLLDVRIGRSRPFLLNSSIVDDNTLLVVDLTNPDMFQAEHMLLPRGTLHIQRSKFLWQKACYEKFRISNFGLQPVRFDFLVRYRADFADIFEIRGTKRLARGKDLPAQIREMGVILGYCGLDDVIRKTRIEFSVKPDAITASEARFTVVLPPKDQKHITMTVVCELAKARSHSLFDSAFSKVQKSVQINSERSCEIRTSNEQFNDWINRSKADLQMMTTETPYGFYPYAGVPWYNTIFGRDGIMTALESLWTNPDTAKGVLSYLAATQATECNDSFDAEPGKILHEVRAGEMVDRGEVPFKKYYGSADATPLFVVLATAYYERTADKAFLEGIWPAVEKALDWCTNYGDLDGDGFVEYCRRSKQGLVNQGWKDSHDSISHADGRLAEGPIALCEVQAYVYQAKWGAARLARELGHMQRSEELLHEAEELKDRFNAAFWNEDMGVYALALDGEKRPCVVRSSNAGHCLYGGIADPDRATRTADTLLSSEMFSGWGIRTLGATEARYNPMSYHNGSIWPHDNAFIALGMARYGLKPQALKVLSAMFDASLNVDQNRLPELFCGFTRRPREELTLYPVACAPQSWASAAVFMLLKASLGLTIDATRSQVCFRYPCLPPELDEIVIKNLKVSATTIDLRLSRYGEDVGINVLKKDGPVDILLIK